MSEAYKVPINSRCKLLEMGHRGQVLYIGRVPEVGPGYFLGIKLDEPYGKNDGSFFLLFLEFSDKNTSTVPISLDSF